MGYQDDLERVKQDGLALKYVKEQSPELCLAAVKKEHPVTTLAGKETSGKPDLSLIPYSVLTALAQVLQFGAEKYGRGNWQKGHASPDLVAAAARHLFKYNSGELLDPESGLPHLDHALTDLALLIAERELGVLRDVPS